MFGSEDACGARRRSLVGGRGRIASAILPPVRVECPAPPAADSRLIDILKEQLARCGPANLTRPECPACNCVAADNWGPLLQLLCTLAVAAAGFVAGARWVSLRGSPPARAEEEALRTRQEGGLRAPRVVTPSSLRAIGPGSASA